MSSPNPPYPAQPPLPPAPPAQPAAVRNPLGIAALALGALILVLQLVRAIVQHALIGSGAEPAAIGLSSTVLSLVGAAIAVAAIVVGLIGLLRPNAPRAAAGIGVGIGVGELFGTLVWTLISVIPY